MLQMGEEFSHLGQSQGMEMDVSGIWCAAITERGSVCSGVIVIEVPQGQLTYFSWFIKLPDQGEDLEWFKTQKCSLLGPQTGCGPSLMNEMQLFSPAHPLHSSPVPSPPREKQNPFKLKNNLHGQSREWKNEINSQSVKF